jgi:hypothetical protein
VNYSPVAGPIDTGSIALNFVNPPANSPETIDLQGFAPSPSQVTVNGQDITSEAVCRDECRDFSDFHCYYIERNFPRADPAAYH